MASSKSRITVPEAKSSLDKMKMEVATELGVDLKAEDLTAKDAGRVGGQMVKKLIENAENDIK